MNAQLPLKTYTILINMKQPHLYSVRIHISFAVCVNYARVVKTPGRRPSTVGGNGLLIDIYKIWLSNSLFIYC